LDLPALYQYGCFILLTRQRNIPRSPSGTLSDPAPFVSHEIFSLPLPEEVPLVFKVQPGYMFDDIVEFWDFVMKCNPTLLELSAQKELIDFTMTFLTSTWYIANPYLKPKIVGVLAMGVQPFGRLHNGVLGDALCTHQLSLDHLMTCLTNLSAGK
jgi:ubiquitin conjugation factor E4 B